MTRASLLITVCTDVDDSTVRTRFWALDQENVSSDDASSGLPPMTLMECAMVSGHVSMYTIMKTFIML